MRRAERQLVQSFPELWTALQQSRSEEILKHSTQCLRLIELIQILDHYRPQSVIELGSGVTTLVFATKVPFTVSFEESALWHDATKRLIAKKNRNRVELILAPRVIEVWNDQRVVRYQRHGDTEAEMIYVDGPTGHDPENMRPRYRLPGVDVLHYLRSTNPRLIVVDGRKVNVDFYRKEGIEARYRMKLKTDFFPPRSRLFRRFQYHTIFESRR